MKNSLSLEGTNLMGSAFVLRRVRTEPLLSAFLLFACAIAAFHIYAFVIDPSLRVLGAALISVAALLPAYMWCRGWASGMPILPLFALTFVFKYAYPLAGDDPIIIVYGDVAGLEAGLLVSAFLLIATVASYSCQKWVPMAHGPVRAMAPGKGDAFFTALILLAGVLVLSVIGHWFAISAGIYSIVRAALTGLASVGIFVLAYRWGAGELDGTKKAFFGASFLFYLVANSMSLFMVEMIVATAFAAAAYVIGGGRVPWKWTLVMLGVFTILHAGKGEMRNEYWWYSDFKPVQIYEYPGFLTEWLEHGWEVLNSPPREDSTSFSERMSLVPLLLKVQAETPDRRPYLNGETYAVIPALLVPRVLYPNKPNAHEGGHILSVHYEVLTQEEETTRIAWGPLNEAYANFGTLGVMVLAILIGALYGGIAKMASGVPILSLRTVIAIVFTALALQVDWTAAVYVSALFQSLIVVCAMSFVLMERRLPRGRNT